MTKPNYQPWEVRVDAFPEQGGIEDQIEFLLKFAILAPSAHNTQPWICKIKTNELFVYFDLNKSLIVGDPERRLLYIALGAFLENLVVTSDYYGFNVEFLKNTSETNLVFNIRFTRTEATKNDPEHLVFQIPLRRNNRYKYENRINQNSIDELERLNDEKSTVLLVRDLQKNEIASTIIAAQIEAMESIDFRKELSHYFKSNYTNDAYGMPGFTLDMPAIISLIVPNLVKKVNFSKLNAKKDTALLLNHTPIIGLVLAKDDNKASWIETGRKLEKLWLIATKSGLACSIWAAAIQLEKYREEIKQKLKLNLKPIIIFRLGKPVINSKPSPRYNVNNILINAP